MNFRKIGLVLLLVLLVGLFFALDLGQYLNLAYLKSQHGNLLEWKSANPSQSTLLFFLVYVAVTAVSLPGATVMTLAIGAIFGLFWGLVLVSFASTL
ncbi:MAG: pyridine nucleotide-disulfide oxidoreductase, partial [Gammaproteobacteria bacterium]|nr:pyridine nucleotide-disulfide oxidoreductase [Gammaproteobacteria bacterium]